MESASTAGLSTGFAAMEEIGAATAVGIADREVVVPAGYAVKCWPVCSAICWTKADTRNWGAR